MAKFLITTWPLSGHIYPNIALAHALRERGHEVAIYTGAVACSVVEREDFTCFPFKKLDGEAFKQLMASGYWTPHFGKRVMKQRAVYRAWLVDTVPAQLSDLEEILPAWSPNVIICDPAMWGPILVLSETHDVSVAIFSYTTGCLLPGREVPLPGMGLPPPRNWGTRLLTEIVRLVTHLLTADIRRAGNDLRRSYGLPPISGTVTEYAGQMPLYLVTSTPAFDYERGDLPSNVHYVGPCLWSKPSREPAPGWMDELPKDRPWVHISEGTLHNQAPILLQAAAQGLANLPMQIIMTTGTHREPAELGLNHLPANVRVERWIPYSELLPRTAVVVTTGGAGTVLAALQTGVPLVVVPTEWDKPENAQRVVESGAGLRLAPGRCTPHHLRAAVERVLDEPSFRYNAERLASDFDHYGGGARAAELLEMLSLDQAKESTKNNNQDTNSG